MSLLCRIIGHRWVRLPKKLQFDRVGVCVRCKKPVPKPHDVATDNVPRELLETWAKLGIE